MLVRPKAAPVGQEECPYCPGNEAAAGREIAAYRKDGSAPDGPDWRVRVVPERDSYFRIEHELVREGVGMFDMITARGASELILESPRHDDSLATIWMEACPRRPSTFVKKLVPRPFSLSRMVAHSSRFVVVL